MRVVILQRWTLLPAALLISALPAAAQGQASKCTCRDGNGCYAYLRSPKKAPGDRSSCPSVVHKRLPREWNDVCLQSPRMECFLKRHAASWGITCSMCMEKKCCPFPNWKNCPECQGDASPNFDRRRKTLRKKLAWAHAVGGSNMNVAFTDEFVLISDLRGFKIRTRQGGIRYARKHELLHLYLQRAHLAREDFTNVFGPLITRKVGKEEKPYRTLMVLVRDEGTRKSFARWLFGNAEMKLLYGAGATLLDDFAHTGFTLEAQNDTDLHHQVRHQIGHVCISTYHSPGIHEKYLPQWIFRGAAHWLAKMHPHLNDTILFCSFEGVVASGAANNWGIRARRIAARGAANDPVEAMFQAATAKQMNYRMHIRAWSWFDVFCGEDPQAFTKFIQGLRDAREPRIASLDAFGQAPEFVDQRWRDRVLKKRRDVSATKGEKSKKVTVRAAGPRERRQIATETDMQLLAGRIRGLERCQKWQTAELLIKLLDTRGSDRVRAVIALVLERTEDPRVLKYLRGKGYAKARKLGRATLCRTFGKTTHTEAVPLLREALDDPFWLVRANALRALGSIKDVESIPSIASIAGTSETAKVRLAAMDALADFGPDAKGTIPKFEKNIEHKAWQVRVATCQTFAAVGDPAAVDPLIERLDREGGRVHKEIRDTLKSLTGVDKPWSGDTWKTWWQKAKAHVTREEKERLEQEIKKTKPDVRDRYAKPPPTTYGIKVFAKGVVYVLDISLSMTQGFEVSPYLQRRMKRSYTKKTRIGVCKEELTWSIRALDPRTRMNVVFFNDRVRTWKSTPVTAQIGGEAAIKSIWNVRPTGQTNYFDALRVVLGEQAAGGDEGGSRWLTRFGDTADTVFFLTDGTPTDGEITKPDELLVWFGERNRFARLRVHVIAMGKTDVDTEFLKAFAEGTGGTFVHLTGTH